MQFIDVHPEVRASSSVTRFDFRLCYPGRRADSSVFFEVHGLEGILPNNFDGILFAIVTLAMRERLGLRLHGQATETALLNLREYQLAWARWVPADYRVVEFEADSVIDSIPRHAERSAVSAYSGGVDASFSLFSHMPGAPGLHRPLSACLLVHGFDIPLDHEAAFTTVLDRARRLHERLGVRTLWARTNCRGLPQNWEHSFAAQLAGCLHLFSSRYSQALIGSSEAYDALVIPWGSSPITDHLLSGGDMQIVHDGAGFSRTEKLAVLARHPGAIDSLRVCWAGDRKDSNCGTCEKCIRTKLNFKAIGIDEPGCFPRPLQLDEIDRMAIRNDVQLAEIRSILDHAERNGMRGEWVRRLRSRAGRGVQPSPRQRLKKALQTVGLLDPAVAVRRRVSGR